MLHRITGYFHARNWIDELKTHVVVLGDPEAFSLGDRVLLSDLNTNTSTCRTIAAVSSADYLSPAYIRLGLLRPHETRLRQISVTNERAETFVFWVGDTRDLRVGRTLHLHDSMHDWRIDSLWIALPPKYVPEGARIGFVQEIF